MAPKPAARKKKKTKEELEEEKRVADEVARLAEEEQKKLQEQERQHLAKIERQRLELLADHLVIETGRLDQEKRELASLMGQHGLERATAAAARQQARDWDRYLSCTYVPHPGQRVAMSDFVRSMHEAKDSQLTETLEACAQCYKVIDEATMLRLEAVQRGDMETAAMLEKDVAEFHAIVGERIDRVTAHALQHADEHANEKNEVQLGCQLHGLQWGLWVNTSKNLRLKSVEMPQLQMLIDIPKTIGVANIAIRVEHRNYNEFERQSSNELMPVGGILYVDLLALPPPAKKIKGWVLRQVTPLSSAVSRIPYPIPPAGSDYATWRSEEEVPALGFHMPLSSSVVILDQPPTVGWWDDAASCWSTEGISDVALDSATSMLSFRTIHLAPLAVVIPRTKLLPYTSWNVRPTGGRNGSSVAITLYVGLPDPIVFEVTPGAAKLISPALPALTGLTHVPMAPAELLLQLSRRGIHLTPEDRDADFVGILPKDNGTERALATDISLMCGVFLLAGSKWNQTVAADEIIVRISEVLDWEEGGRTEESHALRIFAREKEEGPRRVLTVMQRGTKGIAFCDAFDKRYEYPGLPGTNTVEAVQATSAAVYGTMHSGLLSLLRSDATVTGAGVPADAATAARLIATPEGLEQVKTTDPLLSEALAQLILGLRLLSFS